MSARLDTASMQRLGGSLGSHPAAIYRDEQGQRWYVKSLESAAHARNEWLAAQLYRLARPDEPVYFPRTFSPRRD